MTARKEAENIQKVFGFDLKTVSYDDLGKLLDVLNSLVIDTDTGAIVDADEATGRAIAIQGRIFNCAPAIGTIP